MTHKIERIDLQLRMLARGLCGLFALIGVSLSLYLWNRADARAIFIISLATFVLCIISVIATTVSLFRKQSLYEHSRSFGEILADIATDAMVAIFLCGSISLLVSAYIRDSEHATSAVGSHVTAEIAKELLYSSVVALVSFSAFILFRAGLVTSQASLLGLLIGRARDLSEKLDGTHERALGLATETGAGTALASLLNQRWMLEDRSLAQRSLRRERLEVLTEAGSCASHWATYSSSADESTPTELLRLRSGRSFLREATSDIARSERLAVSNIRYVTSLVCSSIIELERVCRNNRKKGKFRPVWLAITTYSPDIWFDDPLPVKQGWFEGTEIPKGTHHVQFWGRYLRSLRFLLNGDDTPIAIRVFKSELSGSSFDNFNELNFSVSEMIRSIEDHVGEDGAQRLEKWISYRLYRDSDEGNAEWVAVCLLLDIEKSICSPDLDMVLPAGRGGVLAKWLKEACLEIRKAAASGEPAQTKAAEGFLRRWHKTKAAIVPRVMRECWDEMLAWELWYFSQVHSPGPKVPVKRAAKAVKPPIPFVDGNPLEVFLDTLLIYCEAQLAKGQPADRARSAMWKRWHGSPGSAVYRFGDINPPDEITEPEERAVRNLLREMPQSGDIHFFGIVPEMRGNVPDWTEARWFSAMKSSMASEIGVARVDFLDIKGEKAIHLSELKGKSWSSLAKVGSELIPISDFVQGLSSGTYVRGRLLEKDG